MTNDKLIIREFQPNDIESLADLTTELGYATSIEQMTKRLETISQLDNYWTFVASFDSKIVGYIGINKNYLWEQDGHYLRIQALVVKKQFRRIGIGQKLIDTVEKLAKQTNTKLILINCGNRDERHSAHQFYSKMGFEPKSTGYIKKIE